MKLRVVVLGPVVGMQTTVVEGFHRNSDPQW